MNKLLGQFSLGVPIKETDPPTLNEIFVYDDRVELVYHSIKVATSESQTTTKLVFSIKKCRKKYAYEDLLLMNETINKIVGRRE